MITTAKQSSILQGFPKYRSMLAGNAAYSPYAFESISTATGTGSSTTITFSSIPSTFKHLQIRGIAKDVFGGTQLDYVRIRFNSDSGSNYIYHYLRGTGAALQSGAGTAQTGILPWYSTYLGTTANIMAVSIFDILDYTSTTKNKTVKMLSGGDSNSADSGISLGSGLWLSTNAITSIDLISGGTGLSTNTTFALYGIKEA